MLHFFLAKLEICLYIIVNITCKRCTYMYGGEQIWYGEQNAFKYWHILETSMWNCIKIQQRVPISIETQLGSQSFLLAASTSMCIYGKRKLNVSIPFCPPSDDTNKWLKNVYNTEIPAQLFLLVSSAPPLFQPPRHMAAGNSIVNNSILAQQW